MSGNTEHSGADVTQLLAAWQIGDSSALEALTPLVFDELRKLAASYMRRERPGHTLQATALVNEAYLKLAGIENKDWRSRAHFFAIAAHIMRQLLMEHARGRNAQKRGGGLAPVQLDEALLVGVQRDEDLLHLDDGLTALAAQDERKSRIIEMRYFGGLEVAEIAEVTGVSVATVGRELRIGLAWLHRYLKDGTGRTADDGRTSGDARPSSGSST
ncbi:sigma-70 family RNA polymerase sigma factor [Paludibaculum fermentans]|uniref:Sigma-70 family RNA polymerase sigma factor n=1 Tax=Paludibaculum fermentans TaxID=1473598 RepID=A0A7S7NW05_PALFE|nr:sigma-70 family RNA polymerase sigma factor [Paludibaculum fermentans]QOY90780.1 sigma-70 family RNA polymerase sigma factor [Paludibaculum fermentans]